MGIIPKQSIKLMNPLAKLGAVIAILIIITFFKLGCDVEKAREDRDRWEDNFKAQSDTLLGLVKTISMEDMLELRPDLMKLIKDSVDAKPKQIESIVTTKVIYKTKQLAPVRDTVIMYQTMPIVARYIQYDDGCLALTAIINDSTDVGEFTIDQSMDVNVVTKWKRKKQALWGLFRYGRKVYSTSVVSTCPNVTFRETDSIKILKD
jgi:hypothetical protein